MGSWNFGIHSFQVDIYYIYIDSFNEASLINDAIRDLIITRLHFWLKGI